jgi:tetratricopeptide (TPR) repeat protein
VSPGGILCRALLPSAFALLASLAAAQELPDSLRGSFEDGVRALRAGRLAEAETAFRTVIAQGGALAFVHNNLGLAYQQQGQHEQAVEQFREAIRKDPRYAAPRVGLGASELALGRVAEATAELERAVKLTPREPIALFHLARAYERGENWAGAVEQYRALRELAPKEPEYAYRLGKAYLGLAEWSLRELRTLDPGSARLKQAMGHNYRVQGRPDQALRALEQAARADPSLPEIHLALAQIHLEQKRFADARRELELELALVPESAGARALLARVEAEEAKAH